MPSFFTDHNEARRRWKNRFDPPSFQNSMKGMYRMTTEVDHVIGEIIQELKEQGVIG